MKSNLFMPKLLKVGFRKREDTYTQQLAYVTYFDEEGTLRKEGSWETWRHKDIDPLEIENVPTSGFVLNKKAGGYSSGWNHRQAYIRIYDPRGFEFEITVENLLYILENTNSIKGKGLEGEFVYGWSGTELILIPTSSPDYEELQAYKEAMYNKKTFKAKDLVPGTTYLTKQNETFVYLGHFDCYGKYDSKHEGKKHFFLNKSAQSKYDKYFTIKSVTQKIIGVLDEQCVANFAELMDELERQLIFSPLDPSQDEYTVYTFNEFVEDVEKDTFRFHFFSHDQRKMFIGRRNILNETESIYHVRFDPSYKTVAENTLKNLFIEFKPMHVKRYLANGKYYDCSR